LFHGADSRRRAAKPLAKRDYFAALCGNSYGSRRVLLRTGWAMFGLVA
jgi:hypothetical protein